MATPTYVRKAKVVNIVDGDTIDIEIDLGYRVTTRQRVRLARINAPERFTPEGRAATAFVQDQFRTVTDVIVETHKNPGDRYGRWLAEIWLDNGKNLNDIMVEDGFAVPYVG